MFLQPEVFQVSVQGVKDKRQIVVFLKEQLENQWKRVIYTTETFLGFQCVLCGQPGERHIMSVDY